MKMIKISVRFPDDHPVKDIPAGQRSERIRELVEIGLKMEQQNNEVLFQLGEIRKILERTDIKPIEATSRMPNAVAIEKEKSRITFDFDAFTDL